MTDNLKRIHTSCLGREKLNWHEPCQIMFFHSFRISIIILIIWCILYPIFSSKQLLWLLLKLLENDHSSTGWNIKEIDRCMHNLNFLFFYNACSVLQSCWWKLSLYLPTIMKFCPVVVLSWPWWYFVCLIHNVLENNKDLKIKKKKRKISKTL